MAKIYYESQADLANLKGKKIAILGYGSQGHAHALSLQDSGLDVRVGLYAGSKSWAKAEADGLRVLETPAACAEADTIMFTLPDPVQSQVYAEDVAPTLKDGDTLMFAHGFNIRYGFIQPPPNVDVTMVAPKAPGHRVREVFKEGSGVPALVAVHQDYSGKALANALAYAKGIGSTRAGVLETTFSEETETDLFGEQTVLCGGVSELVKAGFGTLVEAGYQPEMAYFECMHEMKLIVDLMYEGGLSRMRYSISNTAEYGDYVTGPRLITETVKKEMKGVLKDIQSGVFARNFILEARAKYPMFLTTRRNESEHQIEKVGKELRGMMSWLKKDKKD